MKDQKQIILTTLAEMIGVEIEDINPSDTLKEDLSMSANDIHDFVTKLEENGIDIDLNIDEVETVQDILDFLDPEEFLE